MAKEFFPARSNAIPMIYAYEESNPEYKGLLKVGYTTIDVEKRVAQQYPTKRPDGKKPYHISWSDSAMYSDGGAFTDHTMHRVLKKRGFSAGGECFKCTPMNDAVYKFKRYEDSSLSYTGIDKHAGEAVGG